MWLGGYTYWRLMITTAGRNTYTKGTGHRASDSVYIYMAFVCLVECSEQFRQIPGLNIVMP